MPRLTWVGDEEARSAAQRVPYRLLKSVKTIGDPDAENWLIQGDNLEALKALVPLFAGRIKCIYIDPPYNTRSAFEHYDDNLEHSQWLSMIYPRLELLRMLLAEDGSIWVSIDDKEGQYLKILLDEIFGRKSFVATVVWQKRYSRENREAIGDVHEYIYVYSPNPDLFKARRNRVPLTEEQAKVYRNPNNDPRGRWRPVPMTAQEGHATPEQFYEITTPSGRKLRPPEGRCWSVSKATFERLLQEGRIYFGRNGDSQPNIIRYLDEVPGVTPWTWWPSDEVGHTDESKKEIHALFGKAGAFESPKPERLLGRILHIATNPGELVLDSFLGSGTTAAVAHKMGRRWIGIEMGEHAQTHCLPRLEKVVKGEDLGGVTAEVDWKGGGGFRFVELGPSVFNEDGTINPQVEVQDLAAYVWFLETRTPYKNGKVTTPVLGVHEGTACVLLFKGALGDVHRQVGNVLTTSVWAVLKKLLPAERQRTVVYGDACKLSESRLKELNITFKQIPYEIRMR